MAHTRPNRTGLFLLAGILLAVLASGCGVNQMSGEFANLPVGKAYAEGKTIYFAHTEVSDPEIAKTLTDMMKSPVLVVPSLAKVPESSLAIVYVFDNGIKGMGPLGFQADVFDNPPGAAGYTPLRQIHLVNWKDPAKARELKSAAEVQTAEKSGEVTVQKTGVVVNMPFMVWEGGKR